MTIVEIEGLIMEHKFAEAREALLTISSLLPKQVTDWIMLKVWEAELGKDVIKKQNFTREDKIRKARETFNKLFKEVA